MATPTVAINNSTGSDTAASGAGPATALTGTAAATNGAGLVVTLDGSPDLTNVATDGSHVIWVKTASGQQYAPITAKDNSAKTVTTTSNSAVTFTASQSGLTWAIGGKRSDLNHADTRRLFLDLRSGWTVDIQEAGSNYTLTSTIAVTFQAAPTVLTTIYSSSTTRPTITSATNSIHLFTCNGGQYITFRHLKFTHTATTRGHGLYAGSAIAQHFMVADCVFDGTDVAIYGDNGANWYFHRLVVDSCEIKNCTSHGTWNFGTVRYIDCFIHDNAGNGIHGPANSTEYTCSIEKCIFARNLRAVYTTSGFVLPSTFEMRKCAVVGNTSAGVMIDLNAFSVIYEDNIFYNNGTYGLYHASAPPIAISRNNAFGANATAARNNIAVGTGDVTLTADPFTSSATNDFTLNATAGGGALLKTFGDPAIAPGLLGSSYPDIGPFQAAGGSTTTINNTIVMRGARKMC